MLPINEQLLHAWLRVSTSIVNSRVVSELSYNETLVCNALYSQLLFAPGQMLTATDLCQQTKMLKSQMNRTLNLLEQKGIISRERSQKDKRQVFVRMHLENAQAYEMQHKRILLLLDSIIGQLGLEKTTQLIQTLTDIAEHADRLLGNL